MVRALGACLICNSMDGIEEQTVKLLEALQRLDEKKYIEEFNRGKREAYEEWRDKQDDILNLKET